jgi:predicted RNA-binding Zn ribbon-like protein
MSEPVPHDPGADPRPLIDEPLPIDLLNTRWIEGDKQHDFFEYPHGLEIWLRSARLADRASADRETLDALLATRDALASLVSREADAVKAAEDLNEILHHGWIERQLGPDGPRTIVATDSDVWLPAWSAAEGYLQLLETSPDRIRKCANPECILRFYDVSKNGGRRWCSMANCGNRAKATRHYARHKQQRPSDESRPGSA